MHVWESNELLVEAPNWVGPDVIVVNGNGVLWRLDVATGDLGRRGFLFLFRRAGGGCAGGRVGMLVGVVTHRPAILADPRPNPPIVRG